MNIEVKIDKELIPYNRAIKTLQNSLIENGFEIKFSDEQWNLKLNS